MARTKTKNLTVTTLASADAALAFAVLRDEILAVPEDELLPLNLDIPRAAGRGTLAAERIAPLMAELSGLRGLDLHRVSRLGLYALALHHAHDLATEVGAGAAALPVLLVEAVPLREGMLRSAELLVHFGLFSAERVAAIRSGLGHADMADDLLALGRLFDETWAQVSGKVPVTRAMVDRAPVLGTQLHKALAQREVEDSPLMVAGDRKYVQVQAFTLFSRVYDEARRGVTFLRWREGDAQRFVPSLYPHRPRRAEVVRGDESAPEASVGREASAETSAEGEAIAAVA